MDLKLVILESPSAVGLTEKMNDVSTHGYSIIPETYNVAITHTKNGIKVSTYSIIARSN